MCAQMGLSPGCLLACPAEQHELPRSSEVERPESVTNLRHRAWHLVSNLIFSFFPHSHHFFSDSRSQAGVERKASRCRETALFRRTCRPLSGLVFCRTCLVLRVEFLLKTDSGYPRDAEVTLFTPANPEHFLRFNTHWSAPPVSTLARSGFFPDLFPLFQVGLPLPAWPNHRACVRPFLSLAFNSVAG